METPGESPNLVPPIFGIFQSVCINGVHNRTNHTVGKFLDPRQNWLQPKEFNKGKQLIKSKGGCIQFAPLIKWLTWSLTPVHGDWNHWNLFVCIQTSLLQAISKIRTNQKGMFKKSGFCVYSWPSD